MKRLLVFLMILTPVSPLRAEENRALPPVKTDSRLGEDLAVQVRTQLGENETIFVVERKQGVSTLTLISIGKQSKGIRSSDAQYVFDEFIRLPEASNIPSGCARAKAEIQLLEKGILKMAKTSCIGLKTITSGRYERFMKMLVAL